MRGSVRARGKGWVFVVDLPRIGGKRRQFTSRQFPTRREADKGLREKLGQLDRGQGINLSKETVGQYLTTWLAGRRGRDSTLLIYRQAIEKRITPYLGTILLTRLTAEDIEAWHGELARQRWSPATVSQAHRVLSQALGQAAARGHIVQNPARLVEAPSSRSPEMRVWTADEAGRFLDHVAGTRDELAFQLALSSGLRIGELFALRWEDVDWARSLLAVRRTLSHDRAKGNKWKVEPTKTGVARAVALDGLVLRLLREERERQRFRGQGEGWVFCNRDGGRSAPDGVRRRLRVYAREAGVPPIRFHDLRHTMATLALAGGVPLKVVSERLGHSKITITADRYQHVTETMQAGAAEVLRDALGGS